MQNKTVFTKWTVLKIENKSDSGSKNGVNSIVLTTHIRTRRIRNTLNGKFSIKDLTRRRNGFFSANKNKVLFSYSNCLITASDLTIYYLLSY